MDEFKTLRGLKAMLDDPVTMENEKQNARELINRFAVKHNVDVDKLLQADDKPKDRTFIYKQKWEVDLLHQIVARITSSDPERYINLKEDKRGTRRRVRNVYIYELTDEQYADVQRALEVYLPAYEFEMERLYKSFIQRHRLLNLSRPPRYLEPDDYRETYGLLGGLMDVADPNARKLGSGNS